MKTTIPLYLIAIGIACIGLQNAGIIRPYKLPEITINGPVEVENPRFSQGLNVYVKNFDDIADEEIRVNVANVYEISDAFNLDILDVNLSSIAGQGIVNSKAGAAIGFESTKNTVIPINWGEISISR
jgi:hypothetical protein